MFICNLYIFYPIVSTYLTVHRSSVSISIEDNTLVVAETLFCIGRELL